jgi:hypothetical protein
MKTEMVRDGLADNGLRHKNGDASSIWHQEVRKLARRSSASGNYLKNILKYLSWNLA